MNIIVTGASGFIGKALCKELLKNKHVVYTLSRSPLPLEISNLGFVKHIQYFMGDLLPKEVFEINAELIIHLAWDGIPNFSEENSRLNEQKQINFFSQLNMISSLKKIIVSGSCIEYGLNQGACSEKDRIVPNNYFSWSKLSSLDYLSVYCNNNNMQLVWLRIFYVYGPGQRAESLIPNLITCYRNNIKPELKTPLAAHDYIYIDDVIYAFLSVINTNCEGVYNVGSGHCTYIKNIEKLIDVTINEKKTDLLKLKNDIDIKINKGMWADIKKIKIDLKWLPKINLIDGIKKTINSETEIGKENS